ncbi:hypothetical protein FS837_005375 [Tulasnella sp. UAMH 9824]|nr:hypothetical protein FS837_005375 [Tulasnella sp. UAMH 9824]
MNHLHECQDAKEDYNDLHRRGVNTHNLLDPKRMNADKAHEVGDTHADDEESEVLNVIRELAPHLFNHQLDPVDTLNASDVGLNNIQDDLDDDMIVDKAVPDSSDSTLNLDKLRHSMTEYKDMLESQIPAEDSGSNESSSSDMILNVISEPNQQALPCTKVVHDDNPLLGDDIIDIVDGVMREFELNEQQEQALKVIPYHKISRRKNQLMMIVTGPRGTGKSRVIAALTS